MGQIKNIKLHIVTDIKSQHPRMKLLSKFRLGRNAIPLALSARNGSQYQSFDRQSKDVLYEKHRPTTTFQKGLLAVASAVTAVADPYRGDMVAVLGETTGEQALRKLQLKMLNDDTGCTILKEKPIIDVDICVIDELLTLPENTFGYAYADFMSRNGLTSDTRAPVQYVDNAELAYIMKRYRQIHDFMHVLLDFDVTVSDEIIVKWFEYAHFGLPMTGMSAIFGPLNKNDITNADRERIRKHIPWALYNGYNSKCLLNVYFEYEFDKDLSVLKKELRINEKPF